LNHVHTIPRYSIEGAEGAEGAVFSIRSSPHFSHQQNSSSYDWETKASSDWEKKRNPHPEYFEQPTFPWEVLDGGVISSDK